MIRLDNVVKRYGTRTVVDHVSFGVEANEVVGFLGPNGAGKTTTIRMIAGAITPSSGMVTVAGHDMIDAHRSAARVMGYLPERPPLYDNLTVTGYLRFVARAKGIAKSLLRSELERVLNACRLEHMHKREIFKLSKGYRQRVGLAQALLGEPKVLLLDEPTIGLDPGQIHETREVIRRASEGHAVLLSTHILPEVTLICARVAILHHGRLLAIDTPVGLERAVEQTTAVQAQVKGDATAIRDAIGALEGVTHCHLQPANHLPGELHTVRCLIDDRDGIEARIARALSQHFELYALERQRPTLENVFLHYVNASEAVMEHP